MPSTQLAEDAQGIASRGNQAVAQVISTMATITGSSRRIGDIIGVIDEIAEFWFLSAQLTSGTLHSYLQA